MCPKLFIFREGFISQFFNQMWDHIINLLSSELFCTKTKHSRINEHKNIFKMDNLHFLPNNILIRPFKELKKDIRMTINNI